MITWNTKIMSEIPVRRAMFVQKYPSDIHATMQSNCLTHIQLCTDTKNFSSSSRGIVNPLQTQRLFGIKKEHKTIANTYGNRSYQIVIFVFLAAWKWPLPQSQSQRKVATLMIPYSQSCTELDSRALEWLVC